jgi:hypothetical protein
MTALADQRGTVLFLMLSPAYVRNFESVLRALAERDHSTTVLFEQRKEGGDDAGLSLIQELAEAYGSLDYEFAPELPPGTRGRARMALEAAQDYLRYFDPPYDRASRLRSRALGLLPPALERALAATLRRWPRARGALVSAARRANRRLGADRRIGDELERRSPQALIVTPMVQFRSRQSEWVRAARRLGIGTMLCVYSWDNLINKGLMHALPDKVAVWNEAQRRQAIELHGAAAESILVAGAWSYEHWFDWRPSRSRAELCRELGLSEDRATILYACSSRFIAEAERPAVIRWARALRASQDQRVATANVIVRPHPLHSDQWADLSPDELPGVVIFPPRGADPVDDSSRADYFDSITHADVVVGINTSALVESAIVDRPALAFPGSDFRSSQDDLPHFRQLVDDQAMLRVSASMAEHVTQLSSTLADGAAGAAVRRRFVDSFIRHPDGRTSPTEQVVAQVEELLNGMGGNANHFRSAARG